MFWALPACVHGVPDAPAPTYGAVAAPPAAQDASVAPALATLDEAGLATLLANEGGGTLVVNFWATWCGPCTEELGLLAQAAAAHPDVTFALVSVDDRGQGARVSAFLTQRHISLPVWHLDVPDAPTTLARTVPRWPDLIPVTLVIAPGGEVTARFDGAVEAHALDDALR